MQELGVSPGRFVRQMRIEAAQRMLERTRTRLEKSPWLVASLGEAHDRDGATVKITSTHTNAALFH
jgi:AraC-like DNA-binding protein